MGQTFTSQASAGSTPACTCYRISYTLHSSLKARTKTEHLSTELATCLRINEKLSSQPDTAPGKHIHCSQTAMFAAKNWITIEVSQHYVFQTGCNSNHTSVCSCQPRQGKLDSSMPTVTTLVRTDSKTVLSTLMRSTALGVSCRSG